MKIEINRKNMRNLKFAVENGVVKISAPINFSFAEIMDIYEKNFSEIEKLIEKDKKKDTYKGCLFGQKLNKSYKEREIEYLYREKLEEILPEIFNKYEKLTNLKANQYKIRKMKARWGTCYKNRGLININLWICARPIEEIEALVLHELIHLKYPNHSKDFYKEIEKYMPNYRQIDKKLKHT